MKVPRRLVLAAGHGGRDTGVVSADGKHNERDQTIIMVDYMAEILRGYGRDVIIAPHSHDTHETIPWLNDRFQWGDVWALEIHRDSFGRTIEPDASFRCGIYHGSSSFSKQVAKYYIATMKQTGAHSTSWARDQKESRFNRLGWIAQPRALSHLLELGAIEGRNDKAHLENLARMSANAIQSVLCSVL